MTEQETRIVKQGEPFGFDSLPQDGGAAITKATGTATSMMRAKVEMEASMALARANPRDEQAAFTKVIRSCHRPTFAEKAAYSFSRAGTPIRGASIKLASEIARCWGNMQVGFNIVSETADSLHIRAHVLDLETNMIRFREATCEKLIYRKKEGWIRPDPRDLRELINKAASFLIRNAILESVPPDVVEEALGVVWKTMEASAKGEIAQDPEQAVRRISVAFSQIGVTVEMLKAHLGHELSIISPTELAGLREIYASIKDGNTNVLDHFADSKKGGETVVDQQTGEETPKAPEAPAQGKKRKIGP